MGPEAPPTWRVLSNQRLPLLAQAPPPCSTCPATPSGPRPPAAASTGASRLSAKRLRWIRPMEARFSRSVGAGLQWGSPAPGAPTNQEAPPPGELLEVPPSGATHR